MENYELAEQFVYRYKDTEIRKYVFPQLDTQIKGDHATLSSLSQLLQRSGPLTYYHCRQYLSALKQYNFAKDSKSLFLLFLDIRYYTQRFDFEHAIATLVEEHNMHGRDAKKHIKILRILAGKMLHIIRYEIDENMPVSETSTYKQQIQKKAVQLDLFATFEHPDNEHNL